MRLGLLVGLIISCLDVYLSAQQRELWFPTGQPELVEPNLATVQQPLMDAAGYQQGVERLRGSSSFVPLTELPDSLRADARFGWNLVLGSKNCSWIVQPTSDEGFTLVADLNANGSLKDEQPITMEQQDGYFITVIATTASTEVSGETVAYPITTRIVVTRSTTGQLLHRISSSTRRSGTLRIGEQTFAFRISGNAGIYDAPTAAVWIDLNGDGRGSEGDSPEVFRVREKRLGVGGKLYDFRVDPLGRSLVLTPVAGPPTERLSLQAGTAAPGFTARDVTGGEQSLERYRGRVVLLDFWAVWCLPCRSEAPILNELFRRYTDRGLVVIGIAPDQPPAIAAYVEQHRHDWPQISEIDDGPVHQRYRVIAYPTHLLIDRSGRIAWSSTGGLDDESAKALDAAIASAMNDTPGNRR
jgi:peroxiredoxin